VDFKVGDHIRSEKMQVEGVILNIPDAAEKRVPNRYMMIRLYCTLDATWPPAVNTPVDMTIDRQHWRVTK